MSNNVRTVQNIQDLASHKNKSIVIWMKWVVLSLQCILLIHLLTLLINNICLIIWRILIILILRKLLVVKVYCLFKILLLQLMKVFYHLFSKKLILVGLFHNMH